MKRWRIILLVAGFFCFDFCWGQVEIEWQRCYGGAGYENVQKIITTYDGGYMVVAVAQINSGDVTGNHGVDDFWILKLDSVGNLQWQHSYGGTDFDTPASIVQTADSLYLICGRTRSNDGDVSGLQGIQDAWVIKIDINGNLIWQKCYGAITGYDDSFSIDNTAEGGFVMCGHNGNFWLLKADSAGNMQWENDYGGSQNDDPYSVKQTSDHGYIMCGRTRSNDGDVTGWHGDEDYWVVKVDSAGSLQWQKCFGGSSADWALTILELADGNFVFTGFTGSVNGDVTGNLGPNDIWTIMTDSLGNVQWKKCIGGSGNEHGWNMVQKGDYLYIAGETGSTDGDFCCNVLGIYDAAVVKIDTSGTVIWGKTFGGSSNDQSLSIFNGIAALNDHELVYAAATQSNDGDVSGNHGGSDVWIVKLTDNVNSILGKLFCDLNSNSIKDSNEYSANHKLVVEQNTGRFSFSQPDGSYRVSVLDTGNFIVSPMPLNYYTAMPVSHTANFSGIQQTDSLNDFAFQPLGVFNDLCIIITSVSPFRSGFDATYMITYENVGTTTLTPTVLFFPDNNLSFVSSNPTPTTIYTDSVLWSFGPIAPFQTSNILVTVNVNTGIPIGTLINSSVRIDPLTNDANTSCNDDEYAVLTTGSADPNAILVDRDTVSVPQLASPPFLNYTIFFQNTGNDTAFNARVLNNIPSYLDINSFEFVASSHPMNMSYGAHARLMTFNFSNIQLPDSNINEPMSHGFIRYRIKPLSTLVAGDSIRNTAFIYFDFNAPVQTDTTLTRIILQTGISHDYSSTGKEMLQVFPNPVKEELIVKGYWSMGEKVELKIYDLYGRIIFQAQPQTANINLQTSSYAPGLYIIEAHSSNFTSRIKFIKE